MAAQDQGLLGITPGGDLVGRRRRSGLRSRTDLVAAGLSLAVVLVLWELLPGLGVIDRRVVPPPSDLLTTFHEMYASQDLLGDVGRLVSLFLSGFAAGTAAGMAVGFMSGLSRWFRAATGPIIGLLYPVPILAFYPVILELLGRHASTNVALVALDPFFAMAICSRGALIKLDPIYLDVARSYRASTRDRFRLVIFPATLPIVMGGLRICLASAVTGSVAVEFLLNVPGLGYTLWLAWTSLLLREAMVCLAVIAFVAWLSYLLLDSVERRLLRWTR